MPNYYVDEHPRPDGDHEVHKAGCIHLPYVKNKISLGYLNNCEEALRKAKRYYNDQVNGCDTCIPECHRQVWRQ